MVSRAVLFRYPTYVFPAGQGQPNDPTWPVRTLKTASTAKVIRRWHDNCYTLVTELAGSGAGDEVIMSIAGHVLGKSKTQAAA